MNNTVIIIGAGIAALTAAIVLAAPRAGNTALCIHIIERADQVGGNSALATSGLSLYDSANRADTPQLYLRDLQEDNIMTHQICSAGPDILKLLRMIGVSLPNITQTARHSIPRTYTNLRIKTNIGAYIIGKMVRFLRGVARVSLHLNTRASSISKVRGGWCVHTDRGEWRAASVIVATGGYSSNQQLVDGVRASFPTTNKDTVSGDGIEMLRKNGAHFVNRRAIQIHPTGFITQSVLRREPIPPKVWLCPEMYRAKGAVLLNIKDERFVDEMESRDIISNAIARLPGRVAAMRFPDNIKNISITNTYLKMGHIVYSRCARFPGHPYLAYVTPCRHYTLGGIRTTRQYEVVGRDGRAMRGLYAAGELVSTFDKHRICGLGLVAAMTGGYFAALHILNM